MLLCRHHLSGNNWNCQFRDMLLEQVPKTFFKGRGAQIMLHMLADCPELVQNDVLFGSNMILPEHAVVGVSVGVGGGKDGHLDARGVLVHRARVGLQR